MLKHIVSCLAFVVCLCVLASTSTIKPMECEHFDEKDCKNDTTKCDTITKECDPSEKPGRCFVLWRTDNVTGSPLITMKGCFTHNNFCDQNECIDSNFEPKNQLNFCCCNVDMCNKDHKWIPTSTEKNEVKAPKPKDNPEVLYIVVFTIVFVIAVVLIGLFYFIKQKKTAMFNEIPTIEPEITDSTACLAIRPIELIEMKARGRFGAVWQAKYKGEDVAVKIFPVQDKDSWVSEHEIYKLPRMKHLNILEFIGAEKHTENLIHEFWLITAYHNNGSLCDYLKAYTVTWPQLCSIAESMARGLMHLHEEILSSKNEGLKPAIAHRDFKSKNVLLKNDLTACIADFGLALVFIPGEPCGDTHGQVGTRRYMAPEVLEGAINFTRDAFLRIDVYACGLVLWELVSRCTAHSGDVPSYALPFEPELGVHPSLEEMQENVVIKKLRPKIEDVWRIHSGLNAICDTMEECWDHDAEARLSSSCVMERVAQHTRYPTTHLLIETNTDASTKMPSSESV